MPNSVPVTSLSAEAVFGAVNLTMGTEANPCLPYLQVSGYEWWASTSNDRTAATKLATTVVPFYQHTTAAFNTPYWYWAKTVDASGAVSDFFPATTTSSITATPKTAASLSLSMSASAIVVPADVSGNVTSFAGAASTAKVLDGATDVTAQWSFAAASTGVTVTQAGATFTLAAVAADNGYFDVTATRTGYPTLTARVTVSEAKTGATGAAGASAPALRLTASSQIFQITAAGANSPASITFTAALLGGLAGTPTFTVTAGTATLTGTGLTRTLTFANLTSDTATIQASLSGSTDTITVAKLREGAVGAAGVNAVIALLSNEAHTLQADAAGVVGSFAGAATTITVFEGITNSTASWTLSKVDSGVASTLSGSTVTITAAAADSGYVDITAARSGYTSITKRFVIAKSKQGVQGAAGANAAALRLTASSQIFQVTAAGANSPASITFTAELLGGLSGTPTFSVASGTATLTGTGLTRSLAYAGLTTDTATIQATLSGSTDTVTIAKIREGATGATGGTGAAGAAAVVALLSNEAHTLQADSSGTVSSFAGAATTLTVYEGLTDVSASYTVSKADTGVTSTLATRTVTITAMSADSGYVDITATRSGYPTLTKRFVLAKARAGATGATGPRGSKHFYVSGHSAWSDTAANTASNVEGGKMLNDIVTLYNSTDFSQTRFWNGSAWSAITQAIDGNLLVSGSVGATQISAGFVYAGAVDAAQVTSGTFTGRTFQTSSSGQRVVIDAANNSIIAYNAEGNINARLGGTTDGYIYSVNEGQSSLPAIYGWSVSAQPGVLGIGSGSGDCVRGQNSIGTGNALTAVVTSPIGTPHGLAVGHSGAGGHGISVTRSGSNNGYGAVIATTTSGTGDGLYVSRTNGTGRAALLEAAAQNYEAVAIAKTAWGGSSGHCLRIVYAPAGDNRVGRGILGAANGYFAYSEIGGYGPFTGAHDGVLASSAAASVGDILVDVEVLDRQGVSDVITRVARSTSPLQRTAIGVLAQRRPMEGYVPAAMTEGYDQHQRPKRRKNPKVDAGDWDAVIINSVGEGMVNVCGEGGDIAAGDLITTSSTPGAGMKQLDDLVRSYTVGKAREAATFSNPNQIRQIACIYLCG
jgi:hypothetical protein